MISLPKFATQPPTAASVGFTGTQRGMTDSQKAKVERYLVSLRKMGFRWLHHGDCIGADAEIHDLAKAMGFLTAGHPPINQTKRAFKQFDYEYMAAPYLVRNHHIVDHSQVVIATPKTSAEEIRSGTWTTVRYARKVGVPVYLVLPEAVDVDKKK